MLVTRKDNRKIQYSCNLNYNRFELIYNRFELGTLAIPPLSSPLKLRGGGAETLSLCLKRMKDAIEIGFVRICNLLS